MELMKRECYHQLLKHTDSFVFCLECGLRWYSEDVLKNTIRETYRFFGVEELPTFNNFKSEIEGWKNV